MNLFRFVTILLSLTIPAAAQETSPIRQRLLTTTVTDNGTEPNSAWSVPAADRPALPFQVLVWQYRTDALQDIQLYNSVGLTGFHIDRGEGQEARAQWAVTNDRPFYIDHAAGKGILHLTERSGLNDVPKDGRPAPRPQSFLQDQTWQTLVDRLQRNLPAAANKMTVAIALDDEVSLGSFNSPLEVGFSDASIQTYRQWLRNRFESAEQLQHAFDAKQITFAEASPTTFDGVRKQIPHSPTKDWRLAPWLTFRAFMDRQQAVMFAALCENAGKATPEIPVGIVGAQQPSVYGGFDYSLLRHSVQWMEAYDIGGTNELLHSFWSQSPRRSRMQTFFSSGNLSQDKWFLWYYLAHGNTGVIAWPDLKGKPWFDNGTVHPHIKGLASTFQEIQAAELSVIAAPDTQPVFSDIALLYSHPSVQVGWAIDASTHGSTWPRRSSSLDNQCLSSGKNRVAWTRLLEDIGHQPRIIDTQELINGFLHQNKTKVLILPQCFALSPPECKAIRRFVASGGTVLADYGTAITDNNGTGYESRPLDDLFGIKRSGKDEWFNGQQRFEINGERYRSPFMERLPQEGCEIVNGLPVAECDVSESWIRNAFEKGTTLYMNQSPTAYYDSRFRASDSADDLRTAITATLRESGVSDPFRLTQDDGRTFGVELIRYQTSTKDQIWCLVGNPTRQASVDGAGSGLSIDDSSVTIQLDVPESLTQATDLRRHKLLTINEGQLTLSLKRDEAEILRMAP